MISHLKNIKAVIFDLDGVLVHTDELHYQAWKHIADGENIPFDRKVNHRLRGVSRMESLEIILEKATHAYTPDEKFALAESKNDLYRASLNSLSPLSAAPEVRQLLDTLQKKGYALAIGSSSKNAEDILAYTDLRKYFTVVICGNQLTHSKPHPQVFLKAAEAVGLNVTQCAVIEDARAGVDAAIDGGFVCFAMGDAADYDRATYRLNALDELGGWLL